MVTRRRFLGLLGSSGAAGLALAAGVGCSSSAEDDDAFPQIRFGLERCLHCGMVIDDPRFAAASREPGATSRHFDDIGCLVDDAEERSAPEKTGFFVHDFQTEAWLVAPAASYVRSPEIRTPMASGLAALASHDAAVALATSTNGTTTDWAGLRSLAGSTHGEGHGA
jgi:copper chaperone NosL